MVKNIVLFYSRTGNTKMLALKFVHFLKCDLVEIIDLKKRLGFIGFFGSGRDALKKKQTKIKHDKIILNSYDRIFLGSPVWAGTFAPALRTFIHENLEILKNKKVYLFCTGGGDVPGKVKSHAEEILGKEVVTFYLKNKELKKNEHMQKIKEFLSSIK